MTDYITMLLPLLSIGNVQCILLLKQPVLLLMCHPYIAYAIATRLLAAMVAWFNSGKTQVSLPKKCPCSYLDKFLIERIATVLSVKGISLLSSTDFHICLCYSSLLLYSNCLRLHCERVA